MEPKTVVLGFLDGARARGSAKPRPSSGEEHLRMLKFDFSVLKAKVFELSGSDFRIVRGAVEALLALGYAYSKRRLTIDARCRWSLQRGKKVLTFYLSRALWLAKHPHRHVLQLKACAHACREAAIKGLPPPLSAIGQIYFGRSADHTRAGLYQLSMLGRGLPQPPAFVQERTKESSLSILCSGSPRIIDPERPESIRNFLRTFRLTPVKPEPVCTTTVPSASLTSRRRDGGRGADILKMVRAMAEPRLTPGPATSSLHGQTMLRRRALGQALFDLPHDLRSKTVLIPEFGYKTRVVSCSEAVRIHKSESYRKPLYRLLERLPCCRRGLHDELGSLPFRKDPAGRLIYSADLSAATDRLDHGVLADFCDALHVPHDMVFGGTVDDRPMSTGTLMGIPCSWPMLSIVHAWAIWRAGISLRTCHLKGDDNIGRWTPKEISRYNQLLPRFTGMELNLQKSFVSKDAGTFCEKFFRQNVDGSVTIVPSFSIRGVMDRSSSEGIPYQLRVRRYLWDNVGAIRYRSLTAIQRAWAPEKLRGPRVSLPLRFGGLEVLPIRPESRVSPELGWLYGAIHDGHIEGKELRKLSIPLTASYPKNSPERHAADRLAMLEDGLTYSLHSRNAELEDFWTTMQAESAQHASLLKGTSQPTRLRYWTYRRLVASFRPTVDGVKPHLRLSPPLIATMRRLLERLHVCEASPRVRRALTSSVDARRRYGY
uniref:RNA-dependent RNA polymerase n=1 Tax=Botryosphaeria dothidea narnavirus 4 TaxID=2785368 RepID=A0A7T4X3L1_9VIRU|nr:RNA-dependent RNA polymerase [Botryosphaeria dothidea narnavirus 4]